MRRNHQIQMRLSSLVLLGLILLAGGCAANHASKSPDITQPTQVNSSPAEQPVAGSSGGALVSPGQIPRLASSLPLARFRTGLDYEVALPARNVAASGPALVFTPDWDTGGGISEQDTSWCVYGFNLTGYDGEQILTINWEEGQAPVADTDWYIGLSDFRFDSWHWLTGSSTGPLEVPTELEFIRGDGAAFVVVMVLGTEECELNWIRIGPNMAPAADLSAAPSTGPAPLLANLSAGASLDLDGDLVDYEWDLDGDGEFNEAGSENDNRGLPDVAHTYTANGSYNPTLRVTDNAGSSATATTLIEAATSAVLESGSWGGEADDEIFASAQDSAGNLYHVGSTTSYGGGQSDALIMKYNASGELAWVRSWGSVGEDRAFSIAVSEPGTLHVAGLTTIPDGGRVVLILEYTFAGELLHSEVWGSC